MAVPKTTETRCRDGSVQARQDIKRLHKQPHPSPAFAHSRTDTRESTGGKMSSKGNLQCICASVIDCS